MALIESEGYRDLVRRDLKATLRHHDCDTSGRCTGEHFGEVEMYPCQARLWTEDALIRMARR